MKSRIILTQCGREIGESGNFSLTAIGKKNPDFPYYLIHNIL